MSVFVVHPIGDKSLDISGSKIYGDLVFINKRYIYLDELDGNNIPAEFTKRMLKAVEEFEPDYDYLLIAGDHLQLVTMSALLAERWGRFRVLRYDREAKGYAPVNIDTIGEDSALDTGSD